MGTGTYGEKIRKMVEPVVEAAALELIDVECLRGKARWLVRIYIDSDRGVTVEDCARVSHEVGDVLSAYDIPPGPYDLEVSSPGLDRPLKRDKDFLSCRGRTVKIKTIESIEGRKKFKGRLIDYTEKAGDKTLVVDVDGKHYHIPRNIVEKANLQYEL